MALVQRFGGWLIGLSLLVACNPVAILMEGEPVTTLGLRGGNVVATTPAGYCFDLRSSRSLRGFAVMAPCARLGADMPNPPLLGLVTVQVGPKDSAAVAGSEQRLRAFFDTEAGAVLLSGADTARTVKILSSNTNPNRVIVHFVDSSVPPFPRLQRDEWRVFLDIKGHFVTIAVRGLAADPFRDGDGARLLHEAVMAMVAANAG